MLHCKCRLGGAFGENCDRGLESVTRGHRRDQ